jgi:CubicO group peptidase (beta-lactamase class C family)
MGRSRVVRDQKEFLMNRQYVIPAFLIAISLVSHVEAQDLSRGGSQLDPIQSYLQPLVQNHTIAGAVTLIANRDGVVYLKAVGDRDVAAKAPMAVDDMFWIASTSKPMTATAFMMLVDEGKINLNDPVEKYLPEFKGQMVNLTHTTAAPGASEAASLQNAPQLVPANHPILVREILSHTSGLPFRSSVQPGVLDGLPLKDAVRSFASEPLTFQPGTSYSYSNEGLNTAARIIEVVSGKSYEQFMQERLFNPLGMRETTFWPTAEQVKRLAKSYKLDPQTKGLQEIAIDQLTYPLNDRQHRYPMPAGGLFSTAEDVSKFCRMILNGGTLNGKRYISPESLHEMTSKQNGGMGGTNYGFGWSVSFGIRPRRRIQKFNGNQYGQGVDTHLHGPAGWPMGNSRWRYDRAHAGTVCR